VIKGQVIADGPCTEQGELALGRNVLVAFMPWRGYNFEDAILISRKAGPRGLLHLDPHRGVRDRSARHQARTGRNHARYSQRQRARSARSGRERHHPHRRQIKHNDILVGKVTPKGETQLTPEEKLLRAIFGEKAGDVRDASLTCPPGIEGTVVDVRIFSRKGAGEGRARQADRASRFEARANLGDEIRILTDERLKRLDAFSAARKCWPTCTTSAPTSAADQGRDARPRHHRAHLHRTSSAFATPTRIRA
jgi:DNA-directed RNA polymerase subunit beta